MILTLILFFLLSIIFSFLCSIWEAVLLSITPSFAQIKLEEGTVTGKRIQHFKENIDRPLAAILTLNTIAHTVGAIGVGASAAKIWDETYILGVNVAAVIVPVVMTLAILILSEIIPKTLGANYWKRLAPFTINGLYYLDIILRPLVIISQSITKMLKKDKDRSVLSRADFTAMAQLGAKEGVFQKRESNIIQNLLKLDKVQAKDIMTPRTVVIAADEKTTINDFHNKHLNLRHSRIPVYEGNKDRINGFVLHKDVLLKVTQGKGDDQLKEIRRDILIINEQFPLPDLLNELMKFRSHIALVVDEFGGMAGIVTMEDVIETLLGLEIIDELDNITDMQTFARKNWESRAKQLGILDAVKEQEASEKETINKDVPSSKDEKSK